MRERRRRIERLEETKRQQLKERQAIRGATAGVLLGRIRLIAQRLAGSDLSIDMLSPAERLATGQIDAGFIAYWREKLSHEST